MSQFHNWYAHVVAKNETFWWATGKSNLADRIGRLLFSSNHKNNYVIESVLPFFIPAISACESSMSWSSCFNTMICFACSCCPWSFQRTKGKKSERKKLVYTFVYFQGSHAFDCFLLLYIVCADLVVLYLQCSYLFAMIVWMRVVFRKTVAGDRRFGLPEQ